MGFLECSCVVVEGICYSHPSVWTGSPACAVCVGTEGGNKCVPIEKFPFSFLLAKRAEHQNKGSNNMLRTKAAAKSSTMSRTWRTCRRSRLQEGRGWRLPSVSVGGRLSGSSWVSKRCMKPPLLLRLFPSSLVTQTHVGLHTGPQFHIFVKTFVSLQTSGVCFNCRSLAFIKSKLAA